MSERKPVYVLSSLLVLVFLESVLRVVQILVAQETSSANSKTSFPLSSFLPLASASVLMMLFYFLFMKPVV